MAFLSRAAGSLLAASALFVVGCAAQSSGSASVTGSGSGYGSGSGSGSGSDTAAIGFKQVNLVSDQAGVADHVDVDLVNPWGMALGPQEKAFWIADNATGMVSIVDDTGKPVALPNQTNADGSVRKIDLGVGITGAARNPSINAFLMHAQNGCAAARMLFSNEKGQIIAFNGDIDATQGIVVIDRSAVKASYKGLAVIEIKSTDQTTNATTSTFRILAPDFYNARIDVFDENFQLVNGDVPSAGSQTPVAPLFVDAAMPSGFAPFNVVAIQDKVYVTFAQQDAEKSDEVAGAGLGMVDEFSLDGTFIRTLVPTGQLLDAPWGVALAPANFCNSTANALLIGNFGDGHITAVDTKSGRLIGQLSNDQGEVLVIDGLWALMFGDTTQGVGVSNRLYFTAGPDDETHGLFGYLESNE